MGIRRWVGGRAWDHGALGRAGPPKGSATDVIRSQGLESSNSEENSRQMNHHRCSMSIRREQTASPLRLLFSGFHVFSPADDLCGHYGDAHWWLMLNAVARVVVVDPVPSPQSQSYRTLPSPQKRPPAHWISSPHWPLLNTDISVTVLFHG